jgi:hypothetical protein
MGVLWGNSWQKATGLGSGSGGRDGTLDKHHGSGRPGEGSSFGMFTNFGMVTKWGWRAETGRCIFSGTNREPKCKLREIGNECSRWRGRVKSRVESRIDGGRLSQMISKQLAGICLSVLLANPQVFMLTAPLPRASASRAISPAAERGQATPDTAVSHSASAETQPRCQVTGTRDIAVACDYTALPVDPAQAASEPLIALNHAELQFKTRDDNWMSLELRFTKLNSIPISEAHRAYIEIDDDSGHNFIRRPLPSVNLAGLAPGHPADFKERLMFPALRPGRYQIKLWIPNVDPSLMFKAAHNLLVSSFGVADEKSGLNTISAFSVTR